MKKILIIAPHPDDEILGVGGSMAKWIDEGNEVYVAILTRVYAPDLDETISIIGRKEAKKAHKYLGVKKTIFLDFPVLSLSKVGHVQINKQLTEILESIKPNIMLIPFFGDVHQDHKWFSNSSMVAARPFYEFAPKAIFAYETLSETNWDVPGVTTSFTPSIYIDITKYINKKIEAMKIYKSQNKLYPHARSIESIESLAKYRGCTVNLNYAESFISVRQIL